MTLFLSASKTGISSESSEVPDCIFCSEPLLLSEASHHHSICHDLTSIAKTLPSWHEQTASCMRLILPLVYQYQVLLLDDPFRLPVRQSAFGAVQHTTLTHSKKNKFSMQPGNIRQIALSFGRRCLEAIAQGHRGILISTIQCPNHVVERDRKDTHRERHDGMNIKQWNHGP